MVVSPQCPHKSSNLLHASISALLTNTADRSCLLQQRGPGVVGCSLPGVSAMPLPFPEQVLTLKPLLVNRLKNGTQPVLPSCHSLVASLLLLQLVLWCLPNTGSCGAASRGSGRRSGSRRVRGDGARARVGMLHGAHGFPLGGCFLTARAVRETSEGYTTPF